jgi:hypothetical protein
MSLVSLDLIEGGIDLLIEVVMDMSMERLSPHSTDNYPNTKVGRQGEEQPLASMLRSRW